MSRVAFIFLGQGAQYCGTDEDFYEQTGTDRKVSGGVSELLGFSVPELCFTGDDRLDITKCTQTATVTISIAMTDVLKEHGVRPGTTAGLNLGEYCVLAAASVTSEDDVITTVRQRGILMQEVVSAGVGAMMAILALDAAKIEGVPGGIEDVQIANYSCSGQIVISGKIGAVGKTDKALLAEGARCTTVLNVNGPFHSDMLQGADKKLGAVLEGVEIHQSAVPYVADVTASYVTNADEVRPLLEGQVSSSIRRQQNMETMIADGVDTFIETGPGRTPVGFMKKISKDVKVFSVEKLEGVKKVVEQLKQRRHYVD